MSTSESDARRVEHLLADWLHAVLVLDHATVASVREWHGEAQPGPLVLLPVSPGPTAITTERPLELTVDPPAQDWVRALLAGSSSLGPGNEAIRRSNGSIYLPSADTSGPIRRRAELDSLVEQLKNAEGELNRLSAAAKGAADLQQSAERSLEGANAQADRARQSLREAQGASDDAVRDQHRAEREKSEADQSVRRLTQRLEERSERLKKLEQELIASEQERERLGRDLESHRTTLSDLESAQEAARERRVHWQVEEAQVSAREQSARESESRASKTLASAREEMASLEREMGEIEENTRETTENRAKWDDALAERRVTIQQVETAAVEAEQAVRTSDAAVAAADESINPARDNLEQLNEEAHQAELELTQSAGHRQALVERIEVEWHRALRELLESAGEIDGDTGMLEEEAERLARALEALGPVNPLAVHEHAEEVKRLQFLQEQRDDLVEARKGLLQALREIDETARKMFVETFEQIRENFGNVFQTLFEGGECDVRLMDEGDPLESVIEIFAAPRGKRTQRIHLLSSGERALVALSLLFSIYLTKPAPFCLLDEVDAPLDDANVTRFVRLLDEFKLDTQFIVITHNPRTMQVADSVYGVTMQEPGVSTIVGVRLGQEAVAS